MWGIEEGEKDGRLLKFTDEAEENKTVWVEERSVEVKGLCGGSGVSDDGFLDTRWYSPRVLIVRERTVGHFPPSRSIDCVFLGHFINPVLPGQRPPATIILERKEGNRFVGNI